MRRILPVLIPLIIFARVGVWGIDFGQHWDETEHLQNVRHSLETETLLPFGGYTLNHDPQLALGYYAYPSVLYWITLDSAAPEILSNIRDVTPPWLGRFVMTQGFRLRVRAVCCLVSSLAIVWVYLAALRLSGSVLQGLLAACILGGSWELSYHSRWLAPDTIVMMFAALCLYCLCGAATSKNPRRWVVAAAVACGLAGGTKYPAALLLIPTVIIARYALPGAGKKRIAFMAAKVCGIAFVTFLITTPGAVLQPWPFLHWLAYQHHHYGYETHLGYTVAGPWDHFCKLFVYEFMVLFSHLPWVAVILSLLIIPGAWTMWRQSRPLAMALIVFIVIYNGYFVFQRVMIVRNMLIVAPFLALLIARGGWTVTARRWRIPLVLGGAAAYNFAFIIYAAYTINHPGDAPAALVEYIHSHQKEHFYLSRGVRELLGGREMGISNGRGEGEVVVLSDEGDVGQWPANTWDLIDGQFGAWDVNFNYYPTWRSSRIVMMDVEEARRVGLGAGEAPGKPGR